jgi:hypothetical protein
MHSFGWHLILLKLGFEVMPEVFNWVDVRGLGRTLKYLNVVVRKPLGCMSGGMFWVIVLLEVSSTLLHIQLLKAFNHSIVQDHAILLCIHLPLNLYELSHLIPTHKTPYHEIVTPSMLDSWSCGPV